MSGAAVQLSLLSPEQARRLTDEVKQDAAALWRKLIRLYEGRAHEALGYSSWGEYFETEFGQSGVHGYRLLRAAEVAEILGSNPGVTEKQARELAPLLDEPETLRAAWAETQARAETEQRPVTAALVREVVAERRGMEVHYSSASPEWSTPQDLFDKLDAEFGFVLDVCATDENAKCSRFFTPEQDGLAQTWEGVCWMNPPYGGEIGQWIAKAAEAARSGATVVCLVPARVDTGWWWEHCRFAEVRFLRGRLRFGGGTMGAPFPSAVVIFGRPANVLDAHWELAA